MKGRARICHTGDIGSTDARFGELKDLPKAAYGDQVNWVKALRRKLITPKQSIWNDNYEPIPYPAEPEPRAGVADDQNPRYFPHQKHTEWLDCADCHPDIFNIQKKGTKHVPHELHRRTASSAVSAT